MLNGIDIYHGDGNTWDKDATGFLDFIFVKATEGSGYVDSVYAANVAKARDANIPVGSYHFYRFGDDPLDQAKLFCSVIGAPQKGDLPPVLDWEDRNATNPGDAQIFLDYVEHVCGVTPIIYGGLSFLTDLNLDSKFSRYLLWLAHYSSMTVTPKPWSQLTFWQYAEGGDGTHKYDVNYFNGESSDLQKLVKQ